MLGNKEVDQDETDETEACKHERRLDSPSRPAPFGQQHQGGRIIEDESVVLRVMINMFTWRGMLTSSDCN